MPNQKFTVDNFISAARSCLGTAFHHQGRKKGVGLDCIGLVIFALRAHGYSVHDQLDYGARPEGQKLVDAIIQHNGQRVETIQKGNILLFRYDHQPQHVAIATSSKTLIHAFAPAKAVIETNIGSYWRKRLLSIYRFPFEGEKT